MGKWNEQAAANNNLSEETIASSRLLGKQGLRAEESLEELADGGERNESIDEQLKQHQPGM
ncbi:hypothetical protein [Bacillus sp. REN3]|uniref:hypothetical protein n=1 Tax=Bacillus sp. REN3 TaxID=2802440 RepID=UPI001AEEA359|nr:hypothetical protein [Bacillus sp. REN3]